MKPIVYLSLVLFTVLMACKKNNNPSGTESFHYAYFPITLGSYWIYDVREINHDENAANPHDTLYYQLKTEIGDTLLDNESRVVHRYYRYKRNAPSQAWQLTDLWTTVLANNKAELVEENIRKVSLCFPIKANTTWNPNQFNALTPQIAFYASLHVPFNNGFCQTDSAVKVVSAQELTLVSYKNQWETYGNAIGLVRKVYKDLQIANFDTLNAKQGKELYYDLLEYSH